MSEDKKDKDSSQDKINALKAELKELKAKEEIKKLNNEIEWKDPLGIDWEEPFQGITPKEPL